MADFRRLQVYQSALDSQAIHQLTASFPPHERYGLVQQLRRASVSIPANLAEGMGRQGNRERSHFVNIALGSASELDCLLEVSLRLGYVDPSQHDAVRATLVRTRQLLYGLHRKMQTHR